MELQKIYGISCESGHVMGLGVSIYMSYVGSPKRPSQDEFKELVKKARDELSQDKIWDAILKQMYQEDEKDKSAPLL